MDLEHILPNNIKQFKKYCNDIPQIKHPNIYRQLLIKLVNCISGGSDLKEFQKLTTLISVFTDTMGNEQNLNAWFMDDDNPVRSTNLIILCCKHNRKSCLEYLLVKNEGACLKNLSIDINMEYPTLADTDEQQHNAFYYAIRNGNVQMVEMVLNHFFRKDEESSNEQVEQILASTYNELLLRNVKLSEEMILFVDKRLFELRFTIELPESKSRSRNYVNGTDPEQLQLRIDLVLDTINAITSQYSDEQQFDQKLLFLCRSLVRNVHVLKVKLRATFSTIPWEEMEFIIVAFVLPHIHRQEINIFYLSTLKGNRFFRHLRTFAQGLTEAKDKNTSSNQFPLEARTFLVDAMRKNDAEINELIHDFEIMRDAYSFQKITDAIDLAVSIDLNDPNRLIIISRLLQTIGERFKNTLESPNMSPNASRVIFACLPKTIKENLEKYRNVVSKNATIKNCSRVDAEFIRTIQMDLKELKKIIENIVNEKITLLIHKYLNAICDADTSDEIRKIFEMFDLIKSNFQLYVGDRSHIERLKTLVKELEDMTKNDSNAELFNRVLKELDNPENLCSFSKDECQNCWNSIVQAKDQSVVNKTDMDYLQYLIRNTLKKSEISKREKNMNRLLELIKELRNSLLLDRNADNEADVRTITGRMNKLKLKEIKINEVLKELLVLFRLDSPNLRWIEDLTFEYAQDIENANSNDSRDIVPELFKKLQELLNYSKPELDFEYWNLYKGNAKLQAAVEMIYIDIVSFKDQFSFTYNNSYLDENCVFLMGKELRNHLAHYNSLLDILPINPTRCLLLNAIKLVKEFNAGHFNCPRIVVGRKKVKENLARQRLTFNGQLSVIDNQNDLFVAQKLGQCGEIKRIVQNGADLMGRDIHQQTGLHRAAVHTDLQTIEDLFEIGLDLQAKDVNGCTPLHVSVKHDNVIVTNYFFEKCQPNLKDIECLTPLKPLIYVAAETGSAGMIRLLLKYHADDSVCLGFQPLYICIMSRNADAAKVFIENLDDVNVHSCLGCPLIYVCVEKDMLEIVKLLIRRGADIQLKNDRSSTPLHAACLSGNYEMLKFLLENGADTNINSVNAIGAAPLYMAARTGEYNVIQLLLDYGADPHISHRMLKSTVLHRLCEYGHVESTELILNNINGDYLNTSDVNLRTPAALAAENGHIRILELLLKRINPSIDREQFVTIPLILAVKNGHLNVVKLLIDQTFNVNLQLNTMIKAAECGHIKIVKFFLSLQSDSLKSHLDSIKEAVEFAANNEHFDVLRLLLKTFGSVTNSVFKAAAKNRQILQLILKLNVDINTLNEDGYAVIHYAAINGNREIITDLVASNANICLTTETKEKKTAMVLAAQSNFIDIIEALMLVETPPENELEDCLMEAIKWNNVVTVKYLQKQPTLKKHQRLRCLKNAILLGHTKVVNLLLRDKYLLLTQIECSELLCLSAHYGSKVMSQTILEKGADIEYSLVDNETPLFISVTNNDYGMTKFFIEKYAQLDVTSGPERLTPIIICCKYGYVDVLKLLLDHGADPVNGDFEGKTPIAFAVMHNNLECVKCLLETKKIDVNRPTDQSGNSLLHISAREGQLDITICLWENNADIQQFNLDGAKPIHIAAKENHLKVVEFYLNKGLSVNEKAKHQLSPLHYAAIANKTEMVKFLLKKGANVNFKNEHQCTPLDMAYEAHSLEAVEILLHNGAICTNRPLKCSSNEKCYVVIAGSQKLFECVKADDHNEIERLIKNGKAQVNAKNDDNETILHQASSKGYLKCVKVALANNGDPNIDGKHMFTPLHYAAKMNHFEIVKELLNHGAIYNSNEANGKTACQLTSNEKIKTLFRSISSAFEKIKTKNSDVARNLSQIKDIESLKAVLNARNDRNETILVAAMKSSYPRFIDLQQMNQKVSSDELETQNYNLSVAQRFAEAVAFVRQVKEDRKKLFGPNCVGHFPLDYMIAFHLHNLQRHEEALQLCNELYINQKDLLGETCKYTLDTRCLMATTLHGLGRDKEALEIITSVIAITENSSEQYSVTFESDKSEYHTLGLILQGLGKFEDAFKAFTKAFNYGKKVNGANHQTTLASESNIAQTLLQMGKYDESLEMFENIRDRRAKHLGPYHSDTLRTTFHIIAVHKAKDDKNKVLDEFISLFEKQRKALGASHIDTLRTQAEIGNVLVESFRLHWALKYIEEALPGLTKILGVNHKYVIINIRKLEVIKSAMKSMGLNDTQKILQKLNKDLIDAVSSGNLSEIKVLLTAGADVNTQDNAGFRPMHFAMRRNQKDVVGLLLQKSADPMQMSHKGNTTLHIAASLGHHDLAEILLKEVKDNNFPSFFEFLNAQTKNGKSTALHVAAKGGFVGMVITLLKHGAMFDLIDANGLKPLDCCRDNVNAHKIGHILKECSYLFMEAETKGTQMLKSLTLIKADRELFAGVTNARNYQNKNLMAVVVDNCKENVIKIREFRLNYIRMVQDNTKMLNK